MPTPAVMPRSPFIPRTAQPPYSHVENLTRAELERLGLTALGAMVDVEPYGSSDLGGDPSDDEPPSMTSASPSEDNDPEDPENPSERKKKRKRTPASHRNSESGGVAGTVPVCRKWRACLSGCRWRVAARLSPSAAGATGRPPQGLAPGVLMVGRPGLEVPGDVLRGPSGPKRLRQSPPRKLW